MKNKFTTTLSKLLLGSMFLASILWSCSKDDSPIEEEKDYIKVQSISQQSINGLFVLVGEYDLAAKAKYSVDVYTYKYPMVYKGKSITASGLICVPVSSNSFPLLSFQHGTLVAKSEAPSLNYFQNTQLSALASLGYVVLVPDLIGFGESEEYFHPYLVKESNVSAVSEMILAVRQIDDGELSGASINDSLFIGGYSHGGWLTLAQLHYLENTNDLGFHIIAAACGAGPYDPEQVMDYTRSIETYEKPYYLPYVFLSFIEDGTITNSLSNYIQEPYASAIPNLYNGVNSGNQIDAALTKTMADFYTNEFMTDYENSKFDELRNSFTKNKVGAWNNQTSLLLLHGEADVYIPHEITDSIFYEFLDAGSSKIEMITYPGADHTTAAIPAISDAVTWFETFRK